MATFRLAADASGVTAASAEATLGFQRVGTAAAAAAQKISGYTVSASKAGNAASLLMKTLIAGSGFVIARNTVREAIEVNREYEYSIKELQGVLGGSAEELKKLTDLTRELGVTTRYSAKEAASGATYLARAGFSTNETYAALGGTLDLATVAMTDLGNAADIASNIISQFRLPASAASDVADVLTKAANNSNTSVLQLAEALNYAGPFAASLGLTLEETSSAIGALGNAGIHASMAGTNLRGILAALLDPSEDAKRSLAGLGLTVDTIRGILDEGGLVKLFREFEARNLDAATAVSIFGRRNVSAALSLTQQADALEELHTLTQDADGAASDFARTLEDSLDGSIRALHSASEELLLSMGQEGGVAGLFRSLIDTTTTLMRTLAGAAGTLDSLNENSSYAIALGTTLKGIWKGLTVVWQGAKLAFWAVATAIVEGGAYAIQAGTTIFNLFKKIPQLGEHAAAAVTAVLESPWTAMKLVVAKSLELIQSGIWEVFELARNVALNLGVGVEMVEGMQWSAHTGLGDLIDSVSEGTGELEAEVARHMNAMGEIVGQEWEAARPAWLDGFRETVIDSTKDALDEGKAAFMDLGEFMNDPFADIARTPFAASVTPTAAASSSIATMPAAAPAALTPQSELDRLDKLRDSFKSELELLAAQHEERKVFLEELGADAFESEQERAELLKQLDAQTEAERTEILRRQLDEREELERQQTQQRIEIAQNAANALFTLTETFGSKSLAAQKAWGVAQAVVNTAIGISRSFAEAPFPVAVAQAAVIAASGAAQIATILGASKGGGSVTVGSAGTSTVDSSTQPNTAEEAEATVTRTVSVDIRGSGVMADSVEELIRELNSAVGNGIELTATRAQSVEAA